MRNKGSVIEVCKLCLTENAQLCKSHVLPDFLYEEVYDPKTHSFHVVPVGHSGRPSLKHTGIYERMLCTGCEGILSRYEDYAARVFSGKLKGIGLRSEQDAIVISGIDYSRFKLFQVSLIWRMSVSESDEFKGVELTGWHSEAMRLMLLNGDAGDPDQYGCAMFVDPMRVGSMRKIFLLPEKLRIRGHTCYRAMIGGIFWVFFVSKHRVDLAEGKLFLGRDGVLVAIKETERAWSLVGRAAWEATDQHRDFFEKRKS